MQVFIEYYIVRHHHGSGALLSKQYICELQYNSSQLMLLLIK